MKKLVLSFILLFISLNEILPQNYWEKTNGPASAPISSLVINLSGHIFAGTQGNGIYISTDNGNNWQQTSLKNNWVNCLIINSNGIIFAGTDNGGIFRSTDNGSTWVQCNKNIIWPWVYSFALNSIGHIYAGTFKGGLYYSTDNGDNWNSINTNLSNANITSILFDLKENLFIGTDGHNIYRSSDNGNTWTKMGRSGDKIHCFAISSNGKIFAGISGGITYTINNGDYWDYVYDMDIMATDIRSILISNNNVYAGADASDFWGSLKGVYYSSDEGNKWTHLKSGLSEGVYSLAIDSKGYIYAGAKDGFVYRSVNPITFVESPDTKPKSYYLSQNYPNPFNPVTTLEYSIPQKENVKITIHDILGREIITLINQMQNAGTYKIKFIANELNSGVYFYKMQAGNFSDTKKMLLIR